MPEDLNVLSLSLQLLMGIGLSAACGLRAFLPLFTMGIFERAGFLTLGSHFGWMGSTPALVVFGTAVVVEILGDKFPYIDHALDMTAFVVKPLAGALLASAAIVDMDPLLAGVLGLITGATVSGGVHVAKAGVRMVSTAATGGLANPVVSVLEDVGGAVLTFVALVAPVLVLVVLAAMAYAGYRLWHRRRSPTPQAVPA